MHHLSYSSEAVTGLDYQIFLKSTPTITLLAESTLAPEPN